MSKFALPLLGFCILTVLCVFTFAQEIAIPTPPTIIVMEQDKAQTLPGETFSYLWVTSGFKTCATVKRVDNGLEWTPFDPGVANQMSGSLNLAPAQTGTHIFTLRCKTADGNTIFADVVHHVVAPVAPPPPAAPPPVFGPPPCNPIFGAKCP